MIAVQRELKPLALGDVRWTNAEQLHLTLKFLGNVPASSVEAVKESMAEACAATAPFQLRAEGIGFFPNERQPRVVWVGFEDDENVLADLQLRVERAVTPFAEKPGVGEFPGARDAGPVPEIPPAQDRETPAARAGAGKSRLRGMAGGGSWLVSQRIVAGGRAAHRSCGFPVWCELGGVKLFKTC